MLRNCSVSSLSVCFGDKRTLTTEDFSKRSSALRRETCPSCDHSFPIAKTIRASGKPPAHRMYAKPILLPDGSKAYHPITDEDRNLFAKAERALADRKNAYPVVAIEPSYNTNQAPTAIYRMQIR